MHTLDSSILFTYPPRVVALDGKGSELGWSDSRLQLYGVLATHLLVVMLKITTMVKKIAVLFISLFYIFTQKALASLIASSEVEFCKKTSEEFVEPHYENGDSCEKKFIVALTVRNEQVCMCV